MCPGYPDCENFDCPCDEDDGEMRRLLREADEEEAREYKTLHAKVGKCTGNGRSGGRAAPKKDRKANDKHNYKMPEESKYKLDDAVASHVRAWGFKCDEPCTLSGLMSA